MVHAKLAIRQAFQPDTEPSNVTLESLTYVMSHWPHKSCLGMIATALCCAVFSGRCCYAAEDFAREAEALKTQYAADLDRLADWCRQKNLTIEAKTTADLMAPADPYKIVLPVLPREVGAADCSRRRNGRPAQWQRRLSKLRQDQAAALFASGPTCRPRGAQPPLAYRLALDAIRADPDHEAARRVFGFQKYQNQWHTPFEVQMLRSGMVWHEKFGWIEKTNLPRYIAGERLMGVTWIDAANDAALHADITHGWDIETEHYRIRTNHSIEAAVALGVKLENLNRVWRQIFIGYYASAADVEGLFSGRPASPTAKLAADGSRLLPQ